MKSHVYYKHEMFRDVAIYPVKVYYIPEKETYKVKFYWANIHYNEHFGSEPFFLFPNTDKLEIKKEDLKRWNIYAIRTKEGNSNG